MGTRPTGFPLTSIGQAGQAREISNKMKAFVDQKFTLLSAYRAQYEAFVDYFQALQEVIIETCYLTVHMSHAMVNPPPDN